MGFAALSALLALLSCAQDKAIEVPEFQPRLERGDGGRWWGAHAGTAANSPWLKRPWQRDLASGVEQAWREGKPLVLWLGEGHPFAGPDAGTVAAREFWSERALIQHLGSFVLVADDAAELRTLGGASGAWLARATAGGDPLGAGVWVCAPDGERLAAGRADSATALIATLTAARKAWGERAPLAPDASGSPCPLPREPRRADAAPLDGLLVEVSQRELEEASGRPPDFFPGAFTRRMVWFTREEARALLPRGEGLAPRGTWPRDLALRFAQAALSDAALGAAPDYAPEDVEIAEVVVEAKAKRQGRQTYYLTARFAAAQDGAWQAAPAMPGSAGTWSARGPQARGVRGEAVGVLDVNVATGEVSSLRMTILLQHWDAAGVRQRAALVRHVANWEDAAGFAPPAAPAPDPAAAAPLRVAYADALPEVDGALAERAWIGLPWSRSAAPEGARLKATWNPDFLWLTAWSAEAEVSLVLEMGGRRIEVSADADGTVAGAQRARCVVTRHGEGAAMRHAYEIQVPWNALAEAAGAALPPPVGTVLDGEFRAGAASQRLRLLFEPSRATPGSFGVGGGFR